MSSHRGSSRILLVIWALLTVCLLQGTQQAVGPGRQAGISATTEIFRDATREAGIDFVHFNGMSGERYLCEMMGPGGAMFDYDNDGDLDLYLIQGRMLGPGKTLSDAVFPVSDSKPLIDRLYRNDLQTDEGGGRRLHFTDVTEESGIRSPGYGMGVATGDFDNDGWTDLYVTNFGPNQMFRNNGDGTFADVTAATTTDDPRWSVSAAFLDYDRDGWLDLLAVNGAVSILQPLVQAGDPFPLHQRNQLFRNRGDGRFEDVREHARAVFRPSEVSRGAAFGDLDNDGDVDVVIGNNNGPARLLLNEVGNRNHWLGLRLVGGLPPRDMLGARVGIFRHAHRPLWRRVGSDGSYASASDPRVLVGLGRTPAVQRVEVIWPSGRAEEWTDMAADRWFTLTEGTGRSLR